MKSKSSYSLPNLFIDEEGHYSYFALIKNKQFERLLNLSKFLRLSPKATLNRLIDDAFENVDLKYRMGQEPKLID